MPDLGTRIREARKVAGLSQTSLADAVGTTQGMVSSWETGARTPTADGLVRLATALGVSTDWLLGVGTPA